MKDGTGTPVELFPLRPERVQVIAGEDGWPAAYRYVLADRTLDIALEDEDGWPNLVHLKGFHPTDDHYGAGCLAAAAPAVAVHNAASAWNRALLANAARPSGALVYDGEDGGALSAEQFDRLKAELQNAFQGHANAGRPMLLEGGLDWKAMSLSPADMDFATLKAAAARDIALAFGVPPMLLGLPGDNTYANYREANRALWRLTLLPLAGTPTDPAETSFDIVARQDSLEADVALLRGDVDEVKARVEKIGRVASRPALSGAADPAPEVKGFVDGYLRRGATTEVKSLTAGVPADGGYAVPQQIDAAIARELTAISPIRAIAQVVQTGSAGYRKLITTGGTASGWVSETAARPETDTPEFAEIAPPTGELYANPAASQAMLDDAGFDLESWLASEIAMEFARAEGAAFVAGSGNDQPAGFLTAPTATTPDDLRAFGTLQYLATGAASGLGDAPENRLIDLVHALKAGHRQGASFVMNSATLAEVRKLRSEDGAFLWQPGLVEGQPDRLLGYPVVEAEDMPDIAAGAVPIAFGNFRHG